MTCPGWNMMMIIRLSTELNLSLDPRVQSFPVKRFRALSNPLCLHGIQDSQGRVSL